jgi:alpha-ribazole phosphatase
MSQTIYLIRHTTPAIEKGVCYGQSDLDVTGGFPEEAAIIRDCLNKDTNKDKVEKIYSSPLQRCRKLATHLFPGSTIYEADQLKEIHCGLWEMRRWDDIPREETDPWMKDFVNVRIPGGESYLDLYGRVIPWFSGNTETGPVAIFTHGGVIRSILSYITGTPLTQSFKTFSLHYGCIIRIKRLAGDSSFHHEFLSNIQPAEKEQHKPGTGSTFAENAHL